MLIPKILLTFFLLIAITTTGWATIWPTFFPPDPEFLIKNHQLSTYHCPQGQGKLKSGLYLAAGLFCEKSCPHNWDWLGMSDEGCHDLKTGFSLQHQSITYSRDGNGKITSSLITAWYGESANKLFFKFALKTPDGWYCHTSNRESHTIRCQN